MALSLFGRDPFLSDVNTFGSMGHLDRQMQQMQRRAAAGMRPLAVDITENDRGFTIAADLPGYNKDDVHLTVHDGVLAITAERKVAEETKTDKEWHRERFHGKVQRSVQLPESADEHAVSADFTNGVLKVEIGKKALTDKAGPRRIAIGDTTSGSGRFSE